MLAMRISTSKHSFSLTFTTSLWVDATALAQTTSRIVCSAIHTAVWIFSNMWQATAQYRIVPHKPFSNVCIAILASTQTFSAGFAAPAPTTAAPAGNTRQHII